MPKRRPKANVMRPKAHARGGKATYHIDKGAGTVWAILDKNDEIADGGGSTKFLERLRQVRMEETQFCRMNQLGLKGQSGVSLTSFVSNYIVLYGFPTIEQIGATIETYEPIVRSREPSTSCVTIAEKAFGFGWGEEKVQKREHAMQKQVKRLQHFRLERGTSTIYDKSAAHEE